MAKADNPASIRLQKLIAQAGIASRRKAETLITSGRVAVNGKTVTVLGTKVVPGTDNVTCDGRPVVPESLHYVLLNKPKGCLCAVSDPEGRPTIMEYLTGIPVAVKPVGRLDFNSEGVLILTNDGELSARLQSPDYHVEKTYHVKLRGTVTDATVSSLRKGVTLDDGYHTRAAQIDRLKNESKHDWLVITLTEGKRRQIHRMLAAVGSSVQKIQRVAYGPIGYEGLRVGDARELKQGEVNQLRQMVGLDKSVGSRGQWTLRREQTDARRKQLEKQRREREADK